MKLDEYIKSAEYAFVILYPTLSPIMLLTISHNSCTFLDIPHLRWSATTTPLKGRRVQMTRLTWCPWSRGTLWCEVQLCMKCQDALFREALKETDKFAAFSQKWSDRSTQIPFFCVKTSIHRQASSYHHQIGTWICFWFLSKSTNSKPAMLSVHSLSLLKTSVNVLKHINAEAWTQ